MQRKRSRNLHGVSLRLWLNINAQLGWNSTRPGKEQLMNVCEWNNSQSSNWARRCSSSYHSLWTDLTEHSRHSIEASVEPRFISGVEVTLNKPEWSLRTSHKNIKLIWSNKAAHQKEKILKGRPQKSRHWITISKWPTSNKNFLDIQNRVILLKFQWKNTKNIVFSQFLVIIYLIKLSFRISFYIKLKLTP